MSRVTIMDIDKCTQVDWDRIKDIEVVPRKMVEMIIERYDKIIDDSEKQIACFKMNSNAGYVATVRKSCVRELKAYAESLLKQFEEDDFSNTESTEYLFD